MAKENIDIKRKSCKGPSIKDVSPIFRFLRYPPSPCLLTSPMAQRPLGETSPWAYTPPSKKRVTDSSVSLNFFMILMNHGTLLKFDNDVYFNIWWSDHFIRFSLNIVALYTIYMGKKTSPLLKTGSLPPSPHVSFLGYPPPSPKWETSFMDIPLVVLTKPLTDTTNGENTFMC